METKYPNGLLIRITDIHTEDGYAQGQAVLIGVSLSAIIIRNSVVKGYCHIGGTVIEESDEYPYAAGTYLSFHAAKYIEIGVESMIKKLRYTNIGTDEYLL